MKTKEKLAALRAGMKKRGLHAYLVPSTDPHQSEYVPDCWRRRAWMSGFTGSAGELVVTLSDAALWTDGRYFLQAAQQLAGSGIRLQKIGEKGVPTQEEYLGNRLRKGQVVGVDPRLLSRQSAERLEAAIKERGLKMEFLDQNLVDKIWIDRPEPSSSPIRIHPDRVAGETRRSKLRRLRKEMKTRGADAHVLTALDAIAWVHNIRGQDIAYNPLVISYSVITPKAAVLYTKAGKATKVVQRALAPDAVIRPYEQIEKDLRSLGKKKSRVWIDPAMNSRWESTLLEGAELILEPSPVFLMKAKKNPTEIRGMKQAHVRDGVAMVRFLRWLEDAVPRGGVTEISAARRLEEFRSQGRNWRGPSFETISGYGGHGAIVHYAATQETDVPLRPSGIYLVDSGGQYLDGTTDITRTVLLGKRATAAQKDRFTRVLQGHVALARVRFPAGSPGLRLETLARVPLWEAGLDYNHGTGHGVGAHLGVHEGPQSISGRNNWIALEPGMILSNEPGYYEDGKYGIRTENLILVVEDRAVRDQARRWLRFETITLCPIDRRLIEPKLLSPAERAWIDAYHQRVERVLSPHLEGPETRWLRAACAPLGMRSS